VVVFRTQVFQSQTLRAGADLALRHRLYVSGWALSHVLQCFRTSQNTTDRLALGFCDDQPVAVAIYRDGTIQAFCRKSQRRQGYGGACVRALRAQSARAKLGITGTDRFWQQQNVKCGMYW
jgi:hypothetical protein